MAQRRPSAKSIDTENLQCRTFGHAWQPVVTTRNTDATTRWEVLLRCSRCQTERMDLVDSQGRLAGRAYRYSERYGHVHYLDYGGKAEFNAQARVTLYGRMSSKTTRRKA